MSVPDSHQTRTVSENISLFDVEEMNSKDDMEDAYENLLEKLVDSIVTGRNSDDFEELVETLGVAGTYSARNKFLIKVQNNDVIGPFNGFNQWKEFGRVPEKGSSALWVLAPVKVTYCDESDSRAKYCEECEGRCEDTHKRVVSYRGVTTFAYSQTVEMDDEEKPDDCKDITSITQKAVETERETDEIQELYDSLVESIEDTDIQFEHADSISDWDVMSKGRGYYSPNEKKIVIRNFKIGEPLESLPVEQRISTFIHEIAHALLHDNENELSSAKREMEAESVAYAVCQNLGLETDAGVYISNHLQSEINNEMERDEVETIVEGSVERIADTSREIYDMLN